MYSESLEQLLKLNKNFSGPLVEWNKTATEICRRLTQQNLELASENINRMSERLKRLSNVKKPEDLISLQKDCVQEDIANSVEAIQNVMRTTMQGMEEFTKLFSSSVNETAATATKATERDRSNNK